MSAIAEQLSQPNPVEAKMAHEAPFHDVASVELWYRNLRPDTDIRSVDTGLMVDAVAVTSLQLSGQDLPRTAPERTRKLLDFTTNTESLANKIALAGPPALLVGDLVFDLCANMDDKQPALQDKLYDFGSAVSLKLRENPKLSHEDRLQAHNTLMNLQQAKLKKLYLNGVLGNTPDRQLTDAQRSRLFSDLTIHNIQAEVKWLVNHVGVAPAGDLFETLIEASAKFAVWEREEEAEITVRHATLREDGPTRKASRSAKGRSLAHDVVVEGPGDPVRIQCKFGPDSHEGESMYDTSAIDFITESGEDGDLDNNQKIINVLRAIGDYGTDNNQQIVDAIIDRFNLATLSERTLTHASKVAKVVPIAGAIAAGH